MTLAEIKTAAEESLSHTWSGREIPFGSSIPSAFQDAVRAEKANARNVLWLVERVGELAEALRPLAAVEDVRGREARKTLARLEGE